MSDVFRHLGVGEFPSAREYNRLVDAVSGLLKATGVQYFVDSRGVHVRRMPGMGVGAVCKMRISANQNAPAGSITQIDLAEIIYDGEGNCVGDVSNKRINILNAGTYQIIARAGVQHGASVGESVALSLTTRGAGTGINRVQDIGIDSGSDFLQLVDTVELTADDYIETWITNYDPAIDWTILVSNVSTSLAVMRIK